MWYQAPANEAIDSSPGRRERACSPADWLFHSSHRAQLRFVRRPPLGTCPGSVSPRCSWHAACQFERAWGSRRPRARGRGRKRRVFRGTPAGRSKRNGRPQCLPTVRAVGMTHAQTASRNDSQNPDTPPGCLNIAEHAHVGLIGMRRGSPRRARRDAARVASPVRGWPPSPGPTFHQVRGAVSWTGWANIAMLGPGT